MFNNTLEKNKEPYNALVIWILLTFDTAMRNIVFILLSINIWSCTPVPVEDSQMTELYNILVFTDFDNALSAAGETNKNIFVICDSPYTGCCKKETERTFDYLNKHPEILEKYHILYLNLDEPKVDRQQSNREHFIALTGLITSYCFFTIDKDEHVVKQQNLEIENTLALDNIFKK